MILRASGGLIALAGLAVALAVPVIGSPEGFRIILAGALVLWVTAAAVAAGCVVPARPAAAAAAVAGLCGWASFAWFDAAPAFGALAAAAGALIAVRPGGQAGGRSQRSDAVSDARM